LPSTQLLFMLALISPQLTPISSNINKCHVEGKPAFSFCIIRYKGMPNTLKILFALIAHHTPHIHFTNPKGCMLLGNFTLAAEVQQS